MSDRSAKNRCTNSLCCIMTAYALDCSLAVGQVHECGGPSFGEPSCDLHIQGMEITQPANWTQYEQQQIEMRWLTAAVQKLHELDYIGFTENFDELEQDLKNVWPDLITPDTTCKLGVENPTDYESVGLSHEPDDETRQLLEQTNKLDLFLYEEAKVIAQQKRQDWLRRTQRRRGRVAE